MIGIDIKAEREAVAVAVREVVPEGWTVYAGPPDTESLPCIVVAPGSPYLERATARVWDVGLRLLIYQTVNAGAKANDVLDSVLAELVPRLLTAPTFRVLRVEAGDSTTRGGVPVIAASIPISI